MDETHDSAPQPQDEDAAARLVMLGTGLPAVRFERRLPGMVPQEVWRALTEPEGLRGWFPCAIAAERWQVGGALTFTFPGSPDLTTDGVVLECEPPWALAYLWGEETLRFELEPVAGTADGGGGSGVSGGGVAGPRGTRLVMTDELAAPIAARNAAGWHLCLDRLAGTADAQDRNAWRRLFAAYRAAFEPALGPQEGPPAGFEERD